MNRQKLEVTCLSYEKKTEIVSANTTNLMAIAKATEKFYRDYVLGEAGSMLCKPHMIDDYLKENIKPLLKKAGYLNDET